MRKRGTGTITSNGTTHRARLPGRSGEWLPACATYEEAERLLAASLEKLQAQPEQGGLTLATYGEQVIARRELAGQRSAATDASRWSAHVRRSWIGDIALAFVQREDIVAWCDELATKRAQAGHCHRAEVKRSRLIAKQTAQNVLVLLRVVFQDAVDRGLVASNPAFNVKLPASIRKRARTHETWTYLVPEEQARVLGAAIIPERERLAIAFAIGTGAREAEQWGIRLRDLDRARAEVTLRETKNGKPRTVPLLPVALQAVERWLPRLAQQPNPRGLLWPTVRGCKRAGDHRDWQRWMAQLGLTSDKRADGKHVRWHDLRHTCATSLLCGWWGRRWSLEEVQALLDHESKTTTERYAHIAKSVLEDAAREMVDVATHVTTKEAGMSVKPAAPPARVERTTNGLGSLRSVQQDPRVASVSSDSLATRLREATERAIREVATGGRFVVRRTLELAEVSDEAANALDMTRALRLAGEATS